MRHIYLIVMLLMTGMFGLWAGPALADSPVPPITAQDETLGSATAPVTVIEYASLGCPHCAEFENTAWPRVKTDLIATGKMRYVFRDYPLWAFASRAAVLAHCGGRDNYFAFVETLFQNQQGWTAAANQDEALKQIGLLGGVSGAKFDACEKDPAMQQQVALTAQLGEAAGVQGTPTFFINGKLAFARAITFDELAAAVQAATPAGGAAPSVTVPGAAPAPAPELPWWERLWAEIKQAL